VQRSRLPDLGTYEGRVKVSQMGYNQFILHINRYVRHLDLTVLAIHIKTKLCQLVEAMMKRRDDLAFRQEMKFRNKLVEYLTDWVMGTSHQIAPPGSGDVTVIIRYVLNHMSITGYLISKLHL